MDRTLVFMFVSGNVMIGNINSFILWFWKTDAKLTKLNEPRHEKTCPRGSRQGKTQTDLLSNRNKLEF